MTQNLTRRRFLGVLGGASLVAPLTFFPARAQNAAGQRLGVCSISYALRWPAVDRGRGSVEEMLQFIEHCHELGAGGIQTTVPPAGTFAPRIRSKLEEHGMYLEGQVPLPRAEAELGEFAARVQAAKEAGASVLRTACLGGRRYEVFQDAKAFAEFAQRAEQSLLWAEPVVRKHQVSLAVENHKDWRVPELVRLLERLGSEHVGVCLDTGNSIALLEDPLVVVRALAPFTLATHLKDMAVQEYEKGFLLAEVPLGDGFLDLPQIVSILRQAKPHLQFSLEMITRDPLAVPCLTKPYWATFESVPGWFLAGTLSLVRGHASVQALPHVSGLSTEEKLEKEDQAVRRSLAYAHKALLL